MSQTILKGSKTSQTLFGVYVSRVIFSALDRKLGLIMESKYNGNLTEIWNINCQKLSQYIRGKCETPKSATLKLTIGETGYQGMLMLISTVRSQTSKAYGLTSINFLMTSSYMLSPA